MAVRAWIKNLTFSDGSEISFTKDDIVVIVGPNNAGKSASLRGIRDKLYNHSQTNPVFKGLTIEKEGNIDELMHWLESTTTRFNQPDGSHVFRSVGAEIHSFAVASHWQLADGSLSTLASFFCRFLGAEERLHTANPAGSIALTTEAPSHPSHFLLRDDAFEMKLSQQFKRAFGLALIVHRAAGNLVPIHIGIRPEIKPGNDRVSLAYVLELEKLPRIHEQGDGMKSFYGILLYTGVGSHTILLIDEPEAFLHPPQARTLGQMIVIDKPKNRQMFIATHSGDVLRGILDSNSPDVRVIRLRRSGDVNIARELDNSRIAQLWNDPLLRYSNILDGLFHEKVVVCESDADCRFYAAVMDAIFERKEGARKPDIMFTHCGGKARLPLVIRALKQLEVPIAIVADFDVVREEEPLRSIVEAAGGDWTTIVKDWREVKVAVDGKKPELGSSEVKKDIDEILRKIESDSFPQHARKQIQEVLRRSSPWSTAKSVGTQYVPSGQPSQACVQLFNHLQSLGIFVVPVGELEGFSKTIGAHGPAWVNEVIKKDLRTDPELEAARAFVGKIISV